MNPSSTGGAPGTMTLNDYRIRGFVPEDASNGPSTTALVLASALVVAVLAVDAYVFFGPSRSDSGSPAPAAPRAEMTPAAPTSAVPAAPAAAPGMTSPVGTQPSLARVESTLEPVREASTSARTPTPAKAAANKSILPAASAKSATSRKRAGGETTGSPATDTPAGIPSTPAPPSDATPASSATAPAPVVVPAEPVATAPREPATSSN